jgi:Fibronectin type III domain
MMTPAFPPLPRPQPAAGLARWARAAGAWACLLGLAAGLHAAAIYVSTQGDDANPGTRALPVRTLAHARDLVRALLPTAGGDVTVYLAGGTYRLEAPLVLDARDSGRDGHDVVYTALPGAEPILSGGVRVTGWKLADPARNLWAAPAPAGLADTRQLYVDGVRAFRTRGRLPVRLRRTAEGYLASSAVMAGWRNPSDLEFVYTGGNELWSEPSVGAGSWTEPRCPVAAIRGREILMAEPCWDNSTRRVMLPAGSRFRRTANLVGPAGVGAEPAYVENAYELLGTPGQWYFDRPARTIYYVPRPGEDLRRADVEAPRLERLIVGAGTPERPVHNLVFSGLQFSYATWLFPDTPEGFSEIQANYLVTGSDGYAVQGLGALVPGGKFPYGDWTRIPGNVSFACDRSVRFVGDAFVHLGAAGLELGDGSQRDLVQGCIFTDISGNGLEVGGVDQPEAPPERATRADRILDNRFTDIAAEYHGGVAIVVGYAQRTIIAHNQIDHIPYAGISIGWGGWPDKIHRAGQANDSRGNVIADNLVFDHMQLLSDGGGIYTQGLTGPDLASGERVVGNVVRDQFSTGHAIYSDNGSCNMTVAGNVMFRTNFDNWGSRHSDYYGGRDGTTFDPIAVEGNYWQQGDPDSDRRGVVERGNRLIDSLAQVPAALLARAGLEAPYRDLLGRRFGAPSAPGSPARVAAAAGSGSAVVSWNPPSYDGGSPVLAYLVESSEGGTVRISAPEFLARGYVTLFGLADGAAVTFTVRALNARGESPPSLPSFPVVPTLRRLDPPAAPASVEVHASGGLASVHFRAPASDGGSPVTAYSVTLLPGGRRWVFTGRSLLVLGGRHTTFEVISGVEPGRTYTVALAAINAAGAGPAIVSAPFTAAP